MANDERSVVILLGAHAYPSLQGISAIPPLAESSQLFKEYLLSHRDVLGIESEEFVLDLFDSDDPAGVQTERIERFLISFVQSTPRCRQRNVFFHYAGHGLLLGDEHRLFLAVRQSGKTMNSAINIGNLAEIFSNSAKYSRKLIFLDCCFSAAAARYFLSDPGGLAHIIGSRASEILRQGVPGKLSRGTAMLCAVGKDDPASGELYNGATLFTGALLEAIQINEQREPRITMRELRDRILERMEEIERPELPQMFSLDQVQGDVANNLRVFPTGVGARHASKKNSTTPGKREGPSAGAALLNAFFGYFGWMVGFAMLILLNRDSPPIPKFDTSLRWISTPTPPLNSEPTVGPPIAPAALEQAQPPQSQSQPQSKRPEPHASQKTDDSESRSLPAPIGESPAKPVPKPEGKPANELRTIDDYQRAIKVAKDPTEKRELQIKARGLLSNDMNFGNFSDVRKQYNSTFTTEVGFLSYSPSSNVLSVNYHFKQEGRSEVGEKLPYVSEEYYAVVDIYISKLNRFDLNATRLWVGCIPNQVCMKTVLKKGECRYKEDVDNNICRVRNFEFRSSSGGDKLKRLAAAINQSVTKIDGRRWQD
ncbi:hypothetical protein [Achromobacter insolitus]|uniref:hypothetical protein n=1 Tax=Achromobacter insolitus TaxID=217204 RepID=UPI00367189A8